MLYNIITRFLYLIKKNTNKQFVDIKLKYTNLVLKCLKYYIIHIEFF